jgi:hypothetical protein
MLMFVAGRAAAGWLSLAALGGGSATEVEVGPDRLSTVHMFSAYVYL